jgi:hypothetical protein
MPASLNARLDRAAKILSRPIPAALRIHEDTEGGVDRRAWPLEALTLSTKLQMLQEVRQARPANLSEGEPFALDLTEFSLETRLLVLTDLQDYQTRQESAT